MSFRNTAVEYGTIAKSLHWTIAALFLIYYCSVYYRRWFTVAEEDLSLWVGTPNYTALQLHLASGITIFAFVILRIIWRLYDNTPDLPAGKRWEHISARFVHYSLYFFMIFMPVTGYLGTGADTAYFNITQFRETAAYDYLVTQTLRLDWEAFEKPIDYLHKEIGGAVLVWMLIVLHAGAALYHHFVRRDDVLRRMLPGGSGHNDNNKVGR